MATESADESNRSSDEGAAAGSEDSGDSQVAAEGALEETATSAPEPAATPEPTSTPEPPPTTYTVRSGDSWGLIAENLGIDVFALTAANSATTATILFVGDVLVLPVAESVFGAVDDLGATN